MQTGVRQVFYFHADANSLGGFVGESPDGPFRVVSTPSSVSLSPTGGIATSSAENHLSEKDIHSRASYTYVSGKQLHKNGPWVQRVVSVVEGFSLLGRVTADVLVAQLFIVQPERGKGDRKISFAGSRFENLRIDKKPLTPILNNTLLPTHHRDVDYQDKEYSFTPEISWPELRVDAYRQGISRLDLKEAPSWAEERFGWMAERPELAEASGKGFALCSLVDQIEGDVEGQKFAHTIELPDFGRIFLAEAVIFPYAASLTMIRAELGCAVTGQVSAAAVHSNGTTCPPN